MYRCLKPLIAIAPLVVTTGCAYLTNYTKSIDLKDQSYALDVKQRIVFSQKKPGANGDFLTVVCAEPSPDALTVIGASGGLSLNSAKIDTTGNLGGAFSENGAFIGLRTHSIQLLRDAMYRLCEGYAGGAVSAQTFQSMQRRYQSTMMGLISIEQLTGPVASSHALLTTNAASQSGAPLGDSAVEKAQERVDTTSQALLDAQTKAADEDAKVREAIKVAQVVEKSLLDERAKKKPDELALKELAAKAETARGELNNAKRQSDAAVRTLVVAEDASKASQQNLRTAQSRVSSSASGLGRLGDVSGAIAASNESLTQGVVEIVKEVNVSYLRDSCIGFSSDLIREPELLKVLQGLTTPNTELTVSPVRMVQSLITVCQKILEIDAQRLARSFELSDKATDAARERNATSNKSSLGPTGNSTSVPNNLK